MQSGVLERIFKNFIVPSTALWESSSLGHSSITNHTLQAKKMRVGENFRNSGAGGFGGFKMAHASPGVPSESRRRQLLADQEAPNFLPAPLPFFLEGRHALA